MRLKDKGENILGCYEAGPTGFTLYRQLERDEYHLLCSSTFITPQKTGR